MRKEIRIKGMKGIRMDFSLLYCKTKSKISFQSNLLPKKP